MRLLLIRHGETEWNQDHRVQGLASIGLNEQGWEQARRLALALEQESLFALYSSPLKRALETAQVIGQHLSLEVRVVEDLRELDLGELDGKGVKELEGPYRDFLLRWRQDATIRLPGGEALPEVQERAWAAVQEIVARHPQGTVAAVSHNFTVLTIICRALSLPLSHFRRLRLDLASLSALQFQEGRVSLALFNDSHSWRDQPLPQPAPGL